MHNQDPNFINIQTSFQWDPQQYSMASEALSEARYLYPGPSNCMYMFGVRPPLSG